MTFLHQPLEEAPSKKRQLPSLQWASFIPMILVFGKSVFSIFKRATERKEQQERTRRFITIGIAAVLGGILLMITFTILVRLGMSSLTSFVHIAAAPISTTNNGITNILLLGQGDETGESLTDTIIIASIDPKQTKSIAFLSVPRDLFFLHTDEALPTEDGKLNALWRDARIYYIRQGLSHEEAERTALLNLKDEISAAFNIPIHHAAMVDFAAFEKAVDAIGGIDIDVPKAIHDTEYPGPNYTYQTFHIDAGQHHLDGATALKYARTRSTTSDFSRSERQQHILHAAMNTARDAGLLTKPGKLLELYGIFADHVLTDLSTRQLVTLARTAKDIDQERLLTLQLNNVNGLYDEPQWKGGLLYSPPRDLFDGHFVMLPVSIPEFPVTWKQIHLLTYLFFDNRDYHLSGAQFGILNGGAPPYTASRVGREFIKFGFDVVDITNVPKKKEFSSSHVIYHNTSVRKTAEFFAQSLGIDAEPITETWQEILTGTEGNVTIILGEDFEFTYFQDLIQITDN